MGGWRWIVQRGSECGSCVGGEGAQGDLLGEMSRGEQRGNGTDRNARGRRHRAAKDAGADAPQRDRAQPVVSRQGERTRVARCEQALFVLRAASPYRADGVDDEAGLEAVAARDLGVAGRAAAEGDFDRRRLVRRSPCISLVVLLRIELVQPSPRRRRRRTRRSGREVRENLGRRASRQQGSLRAEVRPDPGTHFARQNRVQIFERRPAMTHVVLM
jgi:hypothetical protein